MQACKPGSVSLCRDPYHLSGPVVTGGIYRPTHPAVWFGRATLIRKRTAEPIWSFNP